MGYKYCKEGHVMERSWKYCPVCLSPLSGWLIEIQENKRGSFYTIHEGKSFIGSGADAEIRILNAELSRQHAYITIFDGICTVVDLGNNLPMKVNNIDTVKTTLIDGDVILLGKNTFKIKML